MRIVGIIQARMGSSRLPGKVLKEVMGKPLLWYMLQRLRSSKKTDRFVVATSASAGDDAIAAFCERYPIDCFRGSEDDVLDRYYRCALAHAADIIVRLTADCPLIDPHIVDRVIDYFHERKTPDLVNTAPGYPEGLDVELFPFRTLETAWREARLPSEREHVTPYIKKDTVRFRFESMPAETDYASIRVVVDETVDLEVVRTVIQELMPRYGTSFGLEEIGALARRRPDIFERNGHILRNEGYGRSVRKDERR